MKGNFVCSQCRQIQTWHGNKFAERLEYRSLDGQNRIGAKTVRYLCKDCAIAALKDEDNQGPLL